VSKKDELKEGIGSKKIFEACSDNTEVSVTVGENGVVSEIIFRSATEPRPIWYENSGNPHDEECTLNYEHALEEMMDTDLDTFKNLLRRIKDTDSKLFNLGNEMLQRRKEQLYKEAKEKYSL